MDTCSQYLSYEGIFFFLIPITNTQLKYQSLFPCLGPCHLRYPRLKIDFFLRDSYVSSTYYYVSRYRFIYSNDMVYTKHERTSIGKKILFVYKGRITFFQRFYLKGRITLSVPVTSVCRIRTQVRDDRHN